MSSIDLDVIVKASQTISNEVCTTPSRFYSFSFLTLNSSLIFIFKVDFDTLVGKMIKAIVENASAQKGTLFLAEAESDTPKLLVCAEYAYESRYCSLFERKR